MDVDYTICSCRQAGLHELIVAGEIRGIKRPAEFAVDKELPCHWQTEDVELVFGNEMAHLTGTVAATALRRRSDRAIDGRRFAGALHPTVSMHHIGREQATTNISATAKVKSSDVDSSVFHSSSQYCLCKAQC